MHTIGRNDDLRSLFLSGWRPYAWIIIAILLLYARTLSFEFTYLDDKDLIVDNYGFISNISNAPQAFLLRVFPKILVPYYRPLLIVSFMIDSAIGGSAPFVYHVTNMLIHGAVCCMVLALLMRLGMARLQAFLFTLFFAVHPALVQAVAWIPGRNDSLLAAFSLASFIAFLSYLDTRKRTRYLLHIVFFGLALFTKETAVVMVAVCLLYLLLLRRDGLSGRQLKLFVTGWLMAVACWSLIRGLAVEGSFASSPDGLLGALFVSTPSVIQYIGKIILPFNLSVFPTIRDTTFIYGALAIAALIIALARSREKRVPLVLFGLAWFGLFLAPSLVRISIGLVHDFQEHRMYLPMVGMLIVFYEIDFFKHLDAKRLRVLAFAAALCVLAAINVRHADNFRNKLAYWENAVATAPHSFLTHMKVAYMYFEEGKFARAEEEYKKALAMERLSPGVYGGLGHVYLAQNRLKEAEFEFRRAIAACNASYPSYVSLGTIYYRQGRLKEAADMWVAALKLYPESVDALRNLAIFCAEQKDYRLAMFYVTKLRELGVEPPPQFLKEIGGT